MSMRLLIFHNRSAGSGETSREDLLGAFRGAGHDARYATKADGPPGDEDLADLDAIVIAGGDGTVVDAFRRHQNFRGRFMIVPLGGANNIARSLGIRCSVEEAAQAIGRWTARPFRLGAVEGGGIRQVFAEGVGFGALAETLAAADSAPPKKDTIRAGREMFADVLAGAEAMRSAVVVDGETLPPDLLFAEVLNVSVTGPSLRFASGSSTADGMLDVAYLPAAKREAFREALLSDRPLPVEMVRGRSAKIDWIGDSLRIDDDFPQPPSAGCQLTITLSDRPVEVLVPSDQERTADNRRTGC